MAAHDLILLSPEKTIITYRLATLGSRIMALIIDLVLVITIIGALIIGSAIVIGFGGLSDTGIVELISLVLLSLGPFLYFILLEGLMNGQTIGKKAISIRVRQSDGTPITFMAALGRNLLLPADLLPGTGFLGLLAVFTNANSQRLGDLAANTIVVHERRPEPIFAAAPHIVGLHPLENYVGDLKGVSLDEYIALRRLCDRFPEFSREKQITLMQEVWSPFSARHSIPSFPGVDPIFIAEAVVMRYGRIHGLL